MKQFIFKGDLTLSGVDFYVEAETLADAQVMARAGMYAFMEGDTGSIAAVTIHADTGRENE